MTPRIKNINIVRVYASLSFTQLPTEDDHTAWEIRPRNKGGLIIDRVEWSWQKNEYCFTANRGNLFGAQRLRDILAFIDALNKIKLISEIAQ